MSREVGRGKEGGDGEGRRKGREGLVG